MRRRLPRILLNAATAVSLVLCIATVVLWVSAQFVNGAGRYAVPGRQFEADVRRNGVCIDTGAYFDTDHPDFHVLRPADFRSWRTSAPRGSVDTGRLGLRVETFPDDRIAITRGHVLVAYGVFRTTSAEVAYWLVLLVTAPLPLARAARYWKRRAERTRGLCPSCGYDLRATPDRCPECGAVPPPPLPPPPSA